MNPLDFILKIDLTVNFSEKNAAESGRKKR